MKKQEKSERKNLNKEKHIIMKRNTKGITLITAILVWILQKIVTLNVPVIGEYVSDIVEIVMKKVY